MTIEFVSIEKMIQTCNQMTSKLSLGERDDFFVLLCIVSKISEELDRIDRVKKKKDLKKVCKKSKL